jgi:hypothetical protein
MPVQPLLSVISTGIMTGGASTVLSRYPTSWLRSFIMTGNFATCPSTQGSLTRLLLREGQSASAAREILNGTAADPRHEFWPDDIPYTEVPTQGIIGHHHDVAELVPDS